ncbi:MAG: hypothetical protein SOZ42_00925 [Candidatus Enterosoma sp.]|nr:hypothetical protein [Candidatus Enterosoma sp.]
MAKLTLKSIVGNVGGGLGKVQFIKNQFQQIESMLGSKSQVLLIGALQNKNALDQIANNFMSIGDDLANSLSTEYKQDGVPVDAIVDYQGEMSVTLTKNPVQKKADVSDHRIPQPKTLVVELGVSNDVVSDLLGQGKKVVAGYASLLGYNLDDKRIVTYKKFEELMLRGQPFTVATPHGIYENMLITRVKPHTTLETEGLFYGTVEFQELIFFGDIKSQGTSPQASGFIGDLADKFKNSLKGLF